MRSTSSHPRPPSAVAEEMVARFRAAAPELAAHVADDPRSPFALLFAARHRLGELEKRAVAVEIEAMYGDVQMRALLLDLVFPILPRGDDAPESWAPLRPAVVDLARKARRQTSDAEFVLALAAANGFAYDAIKADVDEGTGLLPYFALGAVARALDVAPLDPRIPELLERLDAACVGDDATRAAVLTGFCEELEPRWLDPETRPVPFPPHLADAAEA